METFVFQWLFFSRSTGVFIDLPIIKWCIVLYQAASRILTEFLQLSNQLSYTSFHPQLTEKEKKWLLSIEITQVPKWCVSISGMVLSIWSEIDEFRNKIIKIWSLPNINHGSKTNEMSNLAPFSHFRISLQKTNFVLKGPVYKSRFNVKIYY